MFGTIYRERYLQLYAWGPGIAKVGIHESCMYSLHPQTNSWTPVFCSWFFSFSNWSQDLIWFWESGFFLLLPSWTSKQGKLRSTVVHLGARSFIQPPELCTVHALSEIQPTFTLRNVLLSRFFCLEEKVEFPGVCLGQQGGSMSQLPRNLIVVFNSIVTFFVLFICF